jgi:hypothetical protein
MRFCYLAALATGVLTAQLADAPVRPRIACSDLRALTGYEFTIITATNVAATPNAPEHCRVSGQILPEIRFEVDLPAAWGRRFYMFGNGGYAGEQLDNPGRMNQRARGLRQGFAVASTNTGHDAATEPLGTFAVNRQKLLDYAFRSLHVTAVTAKRLIEVYYGSAPVRSYFEGCSTGGRQGLILAQRFPGDFDGIVVGAPVLNFTGTMVSYTRMVKALAAAPIPYEKLKTLADRVYAVCDESDGLNDGLIDDPLRCDFRPSRDLPKCEGGDGADCFTPAQIGTLETIYSDVVVQGKRVFPGWPVGAEVAGANGRSGWDNWIVRDGQKTISHLFAETFFRYLAFPQKDANLELSAVDLEKDLPRLTWIIQTLDAIDPDLTRFRDRGGKIVMYYGWADQALNARMGVEYYEDVLKTMGPKTTDFFRLFMVPGMFHCAGGVGCSTFNSLEALTRWVEQGVAPETLAASRVVDGKTVRTRPLCPYPQVARYTGSGSIDEAANFRCAAPAAR